MSLDDASVHRLTPSNKYRLDIKVSNPGERTVRVLRGEIIFNPTADVSPLQSKDDVSAHYTVTISGGSAVLREQDGSEFAAKAWRVGAGPYSWYVVFPLSQILSQIPTDRFQVEFLFDGQRPNASNAMVILHCLAIGNPPNEYDIKSKVIPLL